MGSSLSHRIVPPLTALVLAVTPALASALPAKDYSKNGATGDYAAAAVVHKNYAMNGATGDYTPPATTTATQPQVRIVRVNESAGFVWSDAAVGAASVLLVALLAGVGIRRIRRRNIGAPSPARPTATV
jgi:hypothetical protein